MSLTKKTLSMIFVALFAAFAFAQDDNVADGDNNVASDSAAVAANEEVVPTDNQTAQTRRAIDLDRLLEDDEYTDIFEEEPEVAAVDSVANAEDDSTRIFMTTESGDTIDITENADVRDSVAANESVTRGLEITVPVNRAALDGDPIIEDGLTINFAQNLSGYRSPRVAMLLSLLVPGLGQAYARNYKKAAAFAGAEVAAIGAAVYFYVAGNSKRDDAYRFADNHFSIKQLEEYKRDLEKEFNNRIDLLPPSEEEDGLLSARDTLIGIRDVALDPYENFFEDAARRSSSFYTSIGGLHYAPGWLDNEPTLDIIIGMGNDNSKYEGSYGTYELSAPDFGGWFYFVTRIVDGTVSNTHLRGYSNNQQRYNSMIDDANSYRDAVNYMFYVMIINHIASAIDAGFTARAYNARLLKEESVFSRLSVEQQFVFTGSEVSPGIALRIRF